MSNKNNRYRRDLVNDEQSLRLGNMIFGESTGQRDNVKKMIGSTAINRMDDKKHRYGKDMDGVLNKKGAYYSVSDKDVVDRNPHLQAATMNFKNKKDEDEYFGILDLSKNLFDRKIKPDKGKFFFKENEANSLKKKLKFVNKVGDYTVYDE